MFPLWQLLCFCSLLTGSSVALVGDLGSGVSNVLSQDDSVVSNGLLGSAGGTVEDVLQKLKIDAGALWNSSLFQQAQTKILEARHLLDNILPKLSGLNNLLRVKIDKSVIADVKAEPEAGGVGINLRFPITADASVNLPLLGELANLGVTLDLLTGVSLITDPNTNLPTVSVGECAVDPASLSLSLMDRRSDLVNNIFDSVSGTVGKLVSRLIQHQVCAQRFNLTPSWYRLVGM